MTRVSGLAVTWFTVALHWNLLLVLDEHQERRFDYRSTHRNVFGYQHERFHSLSTARRILTQPSTKRLRTYRPSCSWTRTNVRNDHKLLHQVQLHMRLKKHGNYRLSCTAIKPDAGYYSNNVHYGALDHNDTILSFWWGHRDYKQPPTGNMKSWQWLHLILPLSLQQLATSIYTLKRANIISISTQTYATTLKYHVCAIACQLRRTSDVHTLEITYEIVNNIPPGDETRSWRYSLSRSAHSLIRQNIGHATKVSALLCLFFYTLLAEVPIVSSS